MSLFTLRTGATAHPEDAVLQVITDAVGTSGVVSRAATNFNVQAQGTPDMTVKVKTGRAYLKGSNGNAYPVISDADTSVAISSNGSGSNRVDAVVLYIDKSASANSDATNVAKLAVVQGTTSAPSDGTVQSSVGASNPFLRLANVTVGSGVTSITSGNIADTRANVQFQIPNRSIQDGWIDALDTWTYVSATTFTIGIDATAYLQPGDKLRWKQGGSYKYGWVKSLVYSAPNTTVTLVGTNLYTLTNAAITDNYYSKMETPVGFPLKQNWAAKAYQSASAQSISNGTVTKLTMDGEVYDPANLFDATSNYNFTAPVDGYYEVTVLGTLNTNGSADRQIGYIYKNNSLFLECAVAYSRAGVPNAVLVSDIVRMAAGDTVDGRIWQDSGTTRTTVNSSSDTFITVRFVDLVLT
jgi:hypothetical protein